MSEEPNELEFDPVEQIERFQDGECFGLEEETYFRLCRTCVTAAGFTPNAISFCAAAITRGCAISFVVRAYEFRIEVRAFERMTLISLFVSRADKAGHGERVFDGRDTPEEWEGLLRTIARVEGFGIHVNHAFNLRSEWSAYIREQDRRDGGEEGF
jgi:hypothetical protein